METNFCAEFSLRARLPCFFGTGSFKRLVLSAVFTGGGDLSVP